MSGRGGGRGRREGQAGCPRVWGRGGFIFLFGAEIPTKEILVHKIRFHPRPPPSPKKAPNDEEPCKINRKTLEVTAFGGGCGKQCYGQKHFLLISGRFWSLVAFGTWRTDSGPSLSRSLSAKFPCRLIVRSPSPQIGEA